MFEKIPRIYKFSLQNIHHTVTPTQQNHQARKSFCSLSSHRQLHAQNRTHNSLHIFQSRSLARLIDSHARIPTNDNHCSSFIKWQRKKLTFIIPQFEFNLLRLIAHCNGAGMERERERKAEIVAKFHIH
jgi:hypothetical protein